MSAGRSYRTIDARPNAESLVKTLLAGDVDVCFANPGTSEMHFVAALDEIPGMRCVLGLFEGVVPGAADGYGRMAGKPACTLLHPGPGLANASRRASRSVAGGGRFRRRHGAQRRARRRWCRDRHPAR